MIKITMYASETCPYCKTIKEKLDEADVGYAEKSIKDHDNEWRGIISLTGIPTVPTIKINDSYLVPGRDFSNPEHLVGIINNYIDSPFSTETMIYERIKTLTYNMHNAFSQVDVILRKLETKDIKK